MPEWQIYMNGVAGKHSSSTKIILIGPKKIKIEYAVQITYRAMNNATEYEALIMRLKFSNELEAESLKILCDS